MISLAAAVVVDVVLETAAAGVIVFFPWCLRVRGTIEEAECFLAKEKLTDGGS